MGDLREHPLIVKLLGLGLPADDFVVFGSGPLMAHGLRESHDLDLLARGAAWQKALFDYGLNHKSDGTPVILAADGEIEIFQGWAPGQWDVDRVIDSADVFDGIRFASLDYTLRWKKLLGRPKDLVDAGLIEDYLKSRPGAAA